MASMFETGPDPYQRSVIDRARRAGLSAYIMNDDGSVVRIRPDGEIELIAARFRDANAPSELCPPAPPRQAAG